MEAIVKIEYNGRMNTHRYEIKDNEWNRIKDMFPPEHPKSGKRGRPAKYDNRSVMNGLLWIARTGAQWRELPERYGKWQAVYARYRLWKQKDLFASIFAALSADADMENLSMDSTSCKVHQSSNGGKKRKTKRSDAPRAASTQKSTR